MRRIFIIFSLLLISSAAHAAGDVETVIKDVVAGTRPMTDLTIVYTAGNADFRGETRLTIEGSGSATVKSTKGTKTESFTKTINAASMQALMKAMLDDKYWTAKGPTSGVARDDEPITITVKTKSGDLDSTLEMPYSNAFENKKTQRTVLTFQSLIKTISKGKIKS
jgi:hypothetical protein